MPLNAWSKHKLRIDGKSHGFLKSMGQSKEPRKIVSDFDVASSTSFTKLEEIYGFADDYTIEFYLIASSSNSAPDKTHLDNLLSHLRKHQTRVLKIYLDSRGTIAFLRPLDADEMHIGQGLDGFKCFVKEHSTADENNISADARNKRKRDDDDSDDDFFPTAAASTVPKAGAMGAVRGQQQQAAQDHYNNLKRTVEGRVNSQIYHLRCLNNVIKTSLFDVATSEYITGNQREIRVLDLACGMGGDVKKWFKVKKGLSRYVGVDIAINSVKQLVGERLPADPQQAKKVTHVVCADLGKDSLTKTALPTHTWGHDNGGNGNGKGTGEGLWKDRVPLTEHDLFDIVSCQFAVHYMFQHRKNADHFFEEVARHLRPGGVFIATTIDIRVIAELLAKDCNEDRAKYACINSGNGVDADSNGNDLDNGGVDHVESVDRHTQLTMGTDIPLSVNALSDSLPSVDFSAPRVLEFRNEFDDVVLKIRFAAGDWSKLLPGQKQHSRDDSAGIDESSLDDGSIDPDAGYGIEYYFSLFDKPDSAAVNAPEWLVPQGKQLEALAEAHGLTVEKCENFQDFFCERLAVPSFWSYLQNKGVFNYKGEIPESDWELARLYTTLILRKKSDGSEDVTTNGATFVGDLGSNGMPSSPDGPPPGHLNEPTSAFSASASAPAFEPHSPNEPAFEPHAPNEPAFEPHSPVEPPQAAGFTPTSPDHPPGGFAPASPDRPPPNMSFAPSSPEGPPPGMPFAPSSPEGPPPGFEPQSPTEPPPHFARDDADGRPAAFAPSSPEGPPPTFAPSSPDGPPPTFAPSSPDGPPPTFAPSSPDGPPPMFAPMSPDGPPPSSSSGGLGFQPVSPDGTPPRFQPQSPETSPPRFTPASPSSPPPPSFAPQSPDGPPPSMGFAPASPEGPPPGPGPGPGPGLQPHSPEGPPPAMSVDGGPEETKISATGMDKRTRLRRIRALAVALAGGEDVWDTLDDDAVDDLMERATVAVDKQGV